MEVAAQADGRDVMTASPAEPTPGRTPNGTLPPLRRRRQNADPLVRPKDRSKRPPQTQRPILNGHLAQQNGPVPGKTQAMPYHPPRAQPTSIRQATPDVNYGQEPVSGFSSTPVGHVVDIPLFTTKKALLEGLRHHVARFASRKPVDPTNPDDFTRPVRLHRRDPRIPVPGKDDSAAAGENGGIDEKQKEMLEAQRAEKRRQQELNMAQIAPSGNTGTQRKNNYGKKTQQIYRNDQTDEQRAASRLRYEEAMPWHLEDFDNKNTWVGTYEAALSDTYAVLMLGSDGNFRMVPVEKWYKFTSKNNFKTLTIDEAEELLKKPALQAKMLSKTHKARIAAEEAQKKEGGAVLRSHGMFLGKFESDGPKATIKSERAADADDLDFDEDRFADDEENPYLEIPEEDAKEIEEKVKRDQLKANFFDNRDEKEADEEEKVQQKEKELERLHGKTFKRSLMKREKNYIYDSDSDNPYSEESESESSGAERRKEEEKKGGSNEKGGASDREKSHIGKTSKNPSGSNTPSGKPSKHPNALKKSPSSNNLKRPGSPNASDVSGNESARKKRKQKHLAPAAPTGAPTLKPPSRPMSPDYAPASSSAPQTQPKPPEALNNKRPRADAGSGSEMSGGEMSEGKKRKKQKLKLRMSASPDQSPNSSRAVSPEVVGDKANGASVGKAASTPAALPPLHITAAEVRACIPVQGIAISELVKCFKGRIHKDQMPEFRKLMKSASRYDNATKMFHPIG
ncbi:MAG: hypothetical protein LQ339_004768 [Xanthoria mediterranea]|nr:MAG: hypothetical protein LQ339_004768 [Xanthoria mediterranea]